MKSSFRQQAINQHGTIFENVQEIGKRSLSAGKISYEMSQDIEDSKLWRHPSYGPPSAVKSLVVVKLKRSIMGTTSL